MEPASRQTFAPAAAGMVLLGALGATLAVGALIGWAAGSVSMGLVVGAIVGIPFGVFSVYRRYRGYFTGTG